MQKYLIDTNVFIQAKNLHYGFSFCEAFWSCVIELHQKGILYSIHAVRKEILAGKDDLSDWVRTLPDGFWLDETELATVSEYSKLMNWAYATDFKEKAKKDFADKNKADAWLVAFAKANGFGVISQEISNPSRRKRFLLADVAMKFDVDYLSIFEFLVIYTHKNFEPRV